MKKNSRTGIFVLGQKRTTIQPPRQSIKKQPIFVDENVLHITKILGEKIIEELKIFLSSIPQKEVVVSSKEFSPQRLNTKFDQILIDESVIDVGIEEKFDNFEKGEYSSSITEKQSTTQDSTLKNSKDKLRTLKSKKGK